VPRFVQRNAARPPSAILSSTVLDSYADIWKRSSEPCVERAVLRQAVDLGREIVTRVALRQCRVATVIQMRAPAFRLTDDVCSSTLLRKVRFCLNGDYVNSPGE
jgi:hypothetical protein